MSLTRKISQLKKSDDLMPDKTWETTTKHDLLSEIASQNRMTQAQKLTSTEKADFFVMNFLNKVSPSFGKVIAGVIIIMMGSGVSIAAQASVPGQALWSIKRSVIEKVETSLALSPIKETEVHIKHAKERSEEIKKILDDDESTQEKKDKKQKDVTQAALHLEKDITAADSALKIVQEEKNPLEVVELVKKVTDATKEVSESLSEDSSGNQNEDIEKVLDSAKQVNEGVKKSAVNVALEVHEEAVEMAKQKIDDENAANTTTDLLIEETGFEIEDLNMEFDTSTIEIIEEEQVEVVIDEELETITNLVKEIIASEIDDASSDIDDAKEKTDLVGDAELQVLKNEKIELETVDVEEELESIGELTEEDINIALDDAKALMDEGFLRNAYNRISQVKEDYEHAEDVLSEIEKAIKENKFIDSNILEQINEEDVSVEEVLDPTAEAKETDLPTEIETSSVTTAEGPEGTRGEESVLEVQN